MTTEERPSNEEYRHAVGYMAWHPEHGFQVSGTYEGEECFRLFPTWALCEHYNGGSLGYGWQVLKVRVVAEPEVQP